MSKDGAVHDLGSDRRNVVVTPVMFKGKGTESEMIEFAHNRLSGMTILEESVSREGDTVYYRARVSSENGIPGSHVAGLILPERLREVMKDRELVVPVLSSKSNVFGFGDIDLNVNVCAFGDI